MSKFKKMYRDFFGLREQNTKIPDEEKIKAATAALADFNKEADKLSETDLEEAQLVNNLSDYNGHVTYYLRDPQEANAVAKEIQRWTTKKGFTIIAHKKFKKGRIGYFYFRLGEDPGSESQKIQGYFAQLPELNKFVFKNPIRKRPSRKF